MLRRISSIGAIGTVLISALAATGCVPSVSYRTDHDGKKVGLCPIPLSVVIVGPTEGAEQAAVARAVAFWNAYHPTSQFFWVPMVLDVTVPEVPVGSVYITFVPEPSFEGKEALGLTAPTQLRNKLLGESCIIGATMVIRKGMSVASTENVLRHEFGHVVGLLDTGAEGLMRGVASDEDTYFQELTPAEEATVHQLYPMYTP